MTDTEKSRIRELRSMGTTMRDIASCLGISVNTVKSFCRREGIVPDQAIDAHDYCKNCGKPLVHLPHRKKKSFCSDQCRYQYWQKQPGLQKRKNTTAYTCKHCGETFYSYTFRKYCCHACYVKARFGGDQGD